ncbi:MAG: DNA polymerase ligase N-terminal domain-containing protein [Dehalococcoidia bacterium]|nr:DNA polymerase ligase N-terminal domain-containing protein [Dehalococcoidia bacterium]
MPARDLAEYRHKRDFSRTPEPGEPGESGGQGPLTFVVHRHEATRLHFDLRLELDGVLMSWAIPKGPSPTTGEKRLAVRTEDHPLSYTGFEGVIPKGEYGGGTSILWDTGTYAPDEPGYLFDDRDEAEAAMRAGLDAGKLSFTLRGTKLKGSWALVKTKSDWLLLKHRDAAANPERELTEMLESAVSGRTNDELEEPWAARDPGVPAHFSPAYLARAKRGEPAPVKPMLATIGGETHPIGRMELRAKAGRDARRGQPSEEEGDGAAGLTGRARRDRDETLGSRGSLAAQPANGAVFDGESSGFDEDGRPSFEVLQQRLQHWRRSGTYGRRRRLSRSCSTCSTCCTWRRVGRDAGAAVAAAGAAGAGGSCRVDNVQAVSTIPLEADDAFAVAVEMGFEGIVAKRDDARYEPGKRSDNWRRACKRDAAQSFAGRRLDGRYGAACADLRRADAGRAARRTGCWTTRGRVGTGFSDAQLRRIRDELDRLATKRNPFAEATPEGRGARYVKPELEVVVSYDRRTAGGQLRAPVFQGEVREEAGTGPDVPDAAKAAARERRAAGAARRRGKAGKGTPEGEGWSVALDEPGQGDVAGARGHGGPVTKRQGLLRYAIEAWPLVGPRLRDRLLTLTRFPNGIGGKNFYQKHWDSKRPEFVETATVYSDEEGKDRDFLLCNNLATLAWLCQLADLEWHAGLARVEPGGKYGGSKETVEASSLNRPDVLLFDLDPYIYRGDEKRGEEPQPGEAGFEGAKDAAFRLKELLDGLALPAFVKMSGATGLHIFVALQGTLDFDAVRAFATTLAGELVRRHPKLATTEWASEKRRGKVFIDANQNARHKALAAAYSPRAHPGAPVSMPLSWDALGKTGIGEYHMGNALDAARAAGDPWEELEDSGVDLEGMLGL